MSNTYFKLSKKDESISRPKVVRMEATLTAYAGGSPYTLQLTVKCSEGLGYITLSEREQDLLIAGILERRGIHPANSIANIQNMLQTIDKISATGCEQSQICPAE